MAQTVKNPGLIPGSGRFLGERNGYPLQYFLPGEFRGQNSLVGYRVGHDVATNTHTHTLPCIPKYELGHFPSINSFNSHKDPVEYVNLHFIEKEM